MVNVESFILTELKNTLNTYYPNVSISIVPPEKETSLPFLYLNEVDNRPFDIGGDNKTIRTFVSYQLDVYTDGENSDYDSKIISYIMCNKIVDLGMKVSYNGKVGYEYDKKITRRVIRFDGYISIGKNNENNVMYRR